LAESPERDAPDTIQMVGLPHVRLTKKRARHYQRRLNRLLDSLLAEAAQPDGEVYGLCVACYVAPEYLQSSPVGQTRRPEPLKPRPLSARGGDG
jgi:hypothetical protein